jgi:glycosyltransferase involved in cell wall biosynthesis
VRFLILSPDVVGERMAGPGIRYWELAHAIARSAAVTLAGPGEQPPPPSSMIQTVSYQLEDASAVQDLVQTHDALLIAGPLAYRFPFLCQVDKPLAIDLYIPSILENLEIHAPRPLAERQGIHAADLGILNQLLQMGDFYVCASEKQRDLWLGALLANSRVNPETYLADVTFRKLIDVVPFGLPSKPAVHTAQVLKGSYPGIGPDDRVVLWGGGIWEWLDPLTLIEAVALLAREGQPVRLFFMGTRHPNPAVPEMRQVELARRRSAELGILNRHVFFNEWVAYHERQNYLLEADVGLSLHLDHVETRFSFRTRVLDYIWACLPMILAEGDTLSDFVARHQLGIIVPPQDVDALVQALQEVFSLPDPRAAYKERFEAVRPLLTWERAAEPLRAFVREPWRAADRPRLTDDAANSRHIDLPAAAPPAPTPWWALPGKSIGVLARRGPRALAAELRSYVHWRRTRAR